jgi:exopolysaccharide biosynthesis polyprenyl glycosylphosphotransferase
MNNSAATPSFVSGPFEAGSSAIAPGEVPVSSPAVAIRHNVSVDFSQLISEATLMFLLCMTSLVVFPRYWHGHRISLETVIIAATWSMLYATAAVLCLRAAGGYVPRALPFRLKTDRCVLAALMGTAGVLALVSFVSRVPAIHPASFVLAGTVNMGAICATRAISRRRVESAVRAGRSGRNVVIVGRGGLAQSLAALIASHQSLGYRMVGFVDDDTVTSAQACLGPINDLSAICRREFVDEIILTKVVSMEQGRVIVEQAREDHIDVTLVPELCSYTTAIRSLGALGDYVTMPIHRERRSPFKLFAKRMFDICGAAIGILATIPIFIVAAVMIKLDSPGPVFYQSRRIGRKGRKFYFFKFRTMVSNAENLQDAVRHLNKREGAFFKIENDPRVTRVGRWLRKYSLDELPQLFNVLIGDMSLVGPRPHTLDDYKHYQLQHLRRLEVLPGITGLWQITARRDPSFDISMALDLEYIASWSIRNDLRILFRTIPIVLSGAGE